MEHNEQYRYGYSEKVLDADLKKAGMFNPKAGPYQMTTESGHDVFSTSDGSTILMGGPRSGKTSQFFMRAIPHAIRMLDMNGYIHDPRGELQAMLSLFCAVQRFSLYSVNFGKFPWASHFCTNVWDHLTPDSPTLVEDCMEAMLDAIPKASSQDGKSRWWEDDARDVFGCPILIWLVERDDAAPSPKTFHEFLARIQGDLDRWTVELNLMSASEQPMVRQFAETIMQLQPQGRESFNAPMSTLKNTFAFCKSRHYADAVSKNDFSLSILAHPKKKALVVSMPPFQHLGLLAAPQRMIISRIVRAKLQNPGGRRIGFWVDEAGQLGVGFRRIPELFTFLGGAGCYTAASYQEQDQAYRCAGSREAGNELIGSAQYRQYRSVASREAARTVSELAGEQTLEYNSAVHQSRAKAERKKVAKSLLDGGSLAEAAADLKHQSLAAMHRDEMQRRLITVGEVLTTKQVITFAARVVKGPIFGKWVAFYDDPKLNGLILNNPNHGETVRIRRRFWPFKFLRYRQVPIVEEPAPKTWQHLPQYQQGHKLRYPKGYRPKIG